jgi:hypothetical protein
MVCSPGQPGVMEHRFPGFLMWPTKQRPPYSSGNGEPLWKVFKMNSNEAGKAQIEKRDEEKEEQDRKLNKSLEDSFPASDPPSTGQFTGNEEPKSRIDRPAAPVLPATQK